MDETEEIVIPKTVRKTGNRGGELFVAGEGPTNARIMIIAPSVLEEEAATEIKSPWGPTQKVKPRYLKGPAAAMFKDISLSVGVDLDQCFYTAVCKSLLPSSSRMQPKAHDFQRGIPALLDEIRRVDPDIIVCQTKPVFEILTGLKIPLKDVAGGWFDSCLDIKAKIYPIDNIIRMVLKPEFVERFRMDMLEVRRMLDRIDGVEIDGDVEEKYQVIRDSEQLRSLVSFLSENRYSVLSVDCEWEGSTHIDGQLRSLQIAWAPGEAAYIRFMDDKLNYTMDVDYKESGRILSEWLDDPIVKYVGHHVSADLPWMHHVLGLQWYGKAMLDTEFAQQTVDEHCELGLERLGMIYTTLGRYDRDLTLWCKKNADKVKDGYGLVPDDILIPYALKDVDVCIRAYPKILKKLGQQNLLEYYFNVFNPFVTDVFTSFSLNGLPVNQDRLDNLRDLYHFCRESLEKEFTKKIVEESRVILFRAMAGICEEKFSIQDAISYYSAIIDLVQDNKIQEAFELFKDAIGPKRLLDLEATFWHMVEAPMFSIRSVKFMRRWLFDVKKYTPVKSTNNKDKGLPSMDWGKVMDLPEARRREFTPSTDKQSVEILQAQNKDTLLTLLLELNAVGNICKAFLKRGSGEEEDYKEAGLHSFLSSDGYIHGMTSTTETGRPRCLHEDSPVVCYGGVKRIIDVREGDLVWTHKNRWQRVTALIEKPVSSMYSVHLSNGTVIKLTDQHLLLTENGKWVSLWDVCKQETIKRPCVQGRSGEASQRDIEYDGGDCEEIQYDSPHYEVYSAEGVERGGVSKTSGDKVFGFEVEGETSSLRKERGREPRLERRLRRRIRLLNSKGWGQTIFRSSDRNGGEVGVACERSTVGNVGSSYRWGPEEQFSGQPSSDYERGSQGDSHEIPKHSRGVKIEKVIPCGEHRVFDISVEVDHSFECCGIFSHNSWKPNSLNWPSWVNNKICDGMARVLVTLKERNELPDEYDHYLKWDDAKKVWKVKVPSIRSCIQAPEGWTMVESDYQTAEIRALAFISEDEDLIRIITESDPCFARVKEDRMVDEDCVCRVAYPEYLQNTHVPLESLAMTYTVDGETRARFTDDDLLKDEQGNILYAKNDLHWSLGEMLYGVPREHLSKKKDRGASKIGNFSCLAAETLIDTDKGPKKIANILTCQKVWDGVEWVSHEGSIKQGNRYVIEYKKLRATPDHVVWTEKGKMCFGDAAIRGVELTQGIPLRRPSGRHSAREISLHETTLREGHACIQSQLQGARYTSEVSFRQRVCDMGSTEMAELGLQGFRLRSDRQRRTLRAGQPAPSAEVKEPTKHAYIGRVSEIKSRGVQGRIPVCGVYAGDCVEYVTERDDCGGYSSEVRVGETQREETTQAGSSTGGATTENEKPSGMSDGEGCRGVDQQRHDGIRNTEEGHSHSPGNCEGYHDTSGYRHEPGNVPQVDEERIVGSGVDGKGKNPSIQGVLVGEEKEAWIELQRKYYSQVDQTGKVGRAARRALRDAGFDLVKEEVYDIINAGPRNRFTAGGYLVSNSAYGATGLTIERKIESDTGIKPEEGTGDRILETLAARQPQATAFLLSMEEIPATTGLLTAASGRKRHFITHPENVPGLRSRTRMGVVSALGREARNFFCQESVAATASLAGVRLLRFGRKHRLQGYPMTILYDSVVTLCPEEEREIWQLAHKLYMFVSNCWRYGERVMNYPIDTELNDSWSSKPQESRLKQLQDPDFKPTEDKHKDLVLWLKEEIEKYENDPQLGVYNTK